MFRGARILVLICGLMALLCLSAAAQDADWRISPEKINIQVGQDRLLQLLDDSANELHDAIWSVDHPELAEITVDGGHVTLHPKAEGTVQVGAAWNGEMRFSEITIWPAGARMPAGTTHWSVHPIGREIRDLPAVPTAEGVDIFSLEQNPTGTLLRAFLNDGMQAWTWRVPEITWNVELVCGDWMGGALISANRPESFTLYAVGKDGNLRWRHTFNGIRKGHAYNLEHLVHVLGQSADGTVTTLTVLDEVTGDQKFEFVLPASHLIQTNVRREGNNVVCASGPISTPIRTIPSELLVNSDGFAYLAFTQNEWTLSTAGCKPGSTVAPRDVSIARNEKIILWQIHPDGTYRGNVVEEFKGKRRVSEPVSVASPSGAIIPDGLDGVLLAVRWSHNLLLEHVDDPPNELVYRVTRDGEVAYKFPLPRRASALHDEMVLGDHDLGFASRGGVLVAFNVRTGKELWRWDSNTPEISVYLATAGGGCVVQTPEGVVLVENGAKTRDIVQGKAIINWQGQWLRTQQ